MENIKNYCELTTGGNRIVATPRGSRYWTTRSEQILEGSFMCKIRVVSIDRDMAENHWSYAVNHKSEFY